MSLTDGDLEAEREERTLGNETERKILVSVTKRDADVILVRDRESDHLAIAEETPANVNLNEAHREAHIANEAVAEITIEQAAVRGNPSLSSGPSTREEL